MMNRTLRAGALGAALIALAACGKDSPTGAGDATAEQMTLDVATAVGDAVSEDVSLMATQEGALGMATTDGLRTGAWRSDCTYAAGTGSFACPSTTRNGTTLERSYRLLDAAGQPMSAFDASLTASATFASTISGSIDRPGISATFSRHRDLTVSGLAGAETQHTLNGSGLATGAHTRVTRDGVTREYTMSQAVTVANVVVPFPRSATGWPLSGTITREVSGSFDGPRGQRTLARTAVVTFNGTQHVPLVVGQRTFTLDLATGAVAR